MPISGLIPSSAGYSILTKGQSVRAGFFNKGDKSAFVDIVYKAGTVKNAN